MFRVPYGSFGGPINVTFDGFLEIMEGLWSTKTENHLRTYPCFEFRVCTSPYIVVALYEPHLNTRLALNDIVAPTQP